MIGPYGQYLLHIIFYTFNSQFRKDSVRGRKERGVPHNELLTSTQEIGAIRGISEHDISKALLPLLWAFSKVHEHSTSQTDRI